jgi:outer membrane protein assembly factor BamB
MGPAPVGSKWAFAAGKSGNAYVLNRYHLGGIGGEVSQAPLCRAFGGSAVVDTVVYVPCTDGLRAVRIDSAGNMHPLWQAVSSRNGSPVVGGGRVWTLDPGGGVLWALDPATGQPTASVSVGAANRFATPAISGQFLLVPTLTGLTVVATS